MKLSKQTSDAVNILLSCRKSGGALLKVADIADELGLTKQMALKLSNRLGQAELLRTVRGPKGGVQLAEQTEALPLGQIVRRLEVVLQTNVDGPKDTPFDMYFDEAFEAFLDVLDQHTLSDLATGQADKKKKASKSATGRREKRVGGVTRRASPSAGAARA